MPSPYLKLYRVKAVNVWPYEDVQSVILVDRKSRAALPAKAHPDERYRVYRRHPDQFISLAPMMTYDDSWEGANGPEISPYQLNDTQPLAYEIEYTLYQSYRASDYAKLQAIIEQIKRGQVDLTGLAPLLRPQRMVTKGDDSTHPWEARRLDGTTPPPKPTSTFFVNERSEIPYINNHTIPPGIDYHHVQAAVVNYDFYDLPPVYADLLKRHGTYCDWFNSLLADPKLRLLASKTGSRSSTRNRRRKNSALSIRSK